MKDAGYRRRKCVRKRPLNFIDERAMLLMVCEKEAAEVIDSLKKEVDNRRLAGLILREDDGPEYIGDIPVVACWKNAPEYFARHWVDEVLIVDAWNFEQKEEIIRTILSMGITVHQPLKQWKDRPGTRQTTGKLGRMTVVSTSVLCIHPGQRFIKRGMDIVFGVMGCLVTGILFLIIAPLIKRCSPGRIFYSQVRIGKNGKPFRMYKFRTMHQDADARKKMLLAQNCMNGDKMFKIYFDPRVIGNTVDENGMKKTGIGLFLRRHSLDEFPQFLNVLKGDMSIVGPRPPLPEEFALYSAENRARVAVKPGITGLWQVSGRNSISDFQEVVRLDTQYIRHFSILLDLKILFKTVLVMISGDGAI